METLVIILCALLAVPVLLVVAPEPQFWGHQARRFRQFKIWQIMVAIALAGVVLVLLNNGIPALALLLGGMAILVLFFKAWRDEFVHLMGLRDEDLPGRHDKLVWILFLLLMPPAGVWFFRSYRLQHWPEPEAEPHAESLSSGAPAAGASGL
jgi:hypothetical protein